MRTSGNTVLITGGSTGIGFALAERFVNLGNKVIICGRNEGTLNEAKKKLPTLHIMTCDISKADDRKTLYDLISEEFKEINILINNAGIQKQIDLTKGADALLKDEEDEIDINFKSQVFMSALFVPLLSKQKEAAIMNVSSGLAFVPLTIFPIYCATKAAVHSFTMSLRQQLVKTQIKVFELIPPTVYDTNLKGKPIEKTEWAVSAAEVADAAIKGLEEDRYQITLSQASKLVTGTNEEREEAFKRMNQR